MTRKKVAPVLPARAHPTPRGVARDTLVREVLPLLSVGEEDPWVRVASRVRTIPDFPAPGSSYRDITPLLADPVALHMVLEDRKSTRLNSSHSQISYAVFCLKKKKKK